MGRVSEIELIQRKTIRVLALGQVLGGFGLGSVLSIGSLLARDLSGSEAWAGSAATFSTLGAAIWAIPLSRLAYARGRRVSLASGAALAINGAIAVIESANLRLFPLLLLGIFLLGAGSATSLQARFAATDIPIPGKTGRSIGLVVWATTIGAVTGPNLFGPGDQLGEALGLPPMTGPFLFTVAAQIGSTLVFWFGLRPDPLLYAQKLQTKTKNKISLKSALQTLKENPVPRFAVFAVALSHMVMVSVMSMTPVHMQDMGYDLVVVGFTISLHIAGMYALSPVMGILADKIGKVQLILLGQLMYLLAIAFAGFGQMDRLQVTIGLTLLGLGWSASTVAGSALLASSVPANEKTNVQGVSDSTMNLSGAIGGGVAGSILSLVAFNGLNFVALVPVTVIIVLSVLIFKRAKQIS
ncbi:MAG: MFS transporter [Microbacteriaceae bacterium]|nr:MFS transporter [Microbacteriaceae bacterium]